jgi:two-component system, cell cycle sensor histidine kinase and response regulator CckA
VSTGGVEKPASRETVESLLAEVAHLRAELDACRDSPWALTPAAQSIADLSPDNIMVLDLEGVVRYINWTVPDLTREQVVGTPVFNYVPEHYRAGYRQCLDRVRETRQRDRYEMAYVASDGDVSYWESRIAPIITQDDVTGFTVNSSNVSERRKAAADRDRFFNLSTEMLVIASTDGYLRRVNPAFVHMLGYTEEELVARPFVDFIHPDDRTSTLAAARELAGGNVVSDFENRYRRKDGVYRWISWRATTDPERGILYGVARDVTDEKLFEAQARHAQWMDAVGQLAGGIAHDFNNLILSILGNVGFAQQENDPEARRQFLDEIKSAADRAADLTRQLLLFSRRQLRATSVLDLNEVVVEAISLLRRVIPASIQIEVVEGRELARVRADRGQLEQVLVNLCLNARDAMPRGGLFEIHTRNVVLDEAFAQDNPWAVPGRYVLMSVRDDGEGMSVEVKERIFEPFFTTKAPGKGAGLGLATVYGIVHGHDGLLHVQSEVGQGTTVSVYVPACEEPVDAARGVTATRTRGGRETILVAEDQEMVRTVVVRMLEAAGYHVLTAADGVEAVAIFREHKDEIALALLDIVMPNMGGAVASAEIRAVRPDVPVLFTSGYSDADRFKGEVSGPWDLLIKPYSRGDLIERVRAAIDRV